MNIFDKIITMSLEEDAPNGDITTIATVSPDAVISGRFVAKADGIICGLEIIGRTFEICGGGFELETYFKDGEAVRKGDIIARVKGNAQTILTGERTALNLIQRASGIATLTAAAVAQIKGTSAKICDTRKTMPGLRVLDKYAVRAGGGSNHRFCLSDGILIKDNHIKAAGSITASVRTERAFGTGNQIDRGAITGRRESHTCAFFTNQNCKFIFGSQSYDRLVGHRTESGRRIERAVHG